MIGRFGWAVWVAVVLFISACRAPADVPAAAPSPDALAVPSQFEDVRLASLEAPTALAFTPDGRLLITTQTGQVRVYQNGSLRAAPLLDLKGQICTNGARGIFGIAVDPNFATNGFIYLYYTFDKAGTGTCERGRNGRAVNRVSRFTVSGNAAALSSERVLIDNIPAPFGNHSAGDVAIGKDGLLYVTVGDAGCDPSGRSGCSAENAAARDRHTLLGKVIRITRSGDVPQGNPFRGVDSVRCNRGSAAPGSVCQEIFALGLRNPFRFAFDPNSSGTRFFINDVGQAAREEINLGRAGADYGWNVREGSCKVGGTDCGAAPAGMTNPIFEYAHGASGLFAGCTSVTGGAFVPRGVWPAAFEGAYLFSDYVCGKIFALTPTDSGYRASLFADGLGNSSAIHLRFGPHGGSQALFYTTYAGGGQVRRIAYTGALNRAPQAVVTASPTSGPAPLRVTFDASGSRDPEGEALSYTWRFGDGATGSGPRVTHTYAKGDYTATLIVRDPQGAEGRAVVRISAGNTPPQPVITAPAPGALFGVGERITLRGAATDAEDGTLSGSQLSWRVLLRHDDHTHPYERATGREVTITMPPPEDLAATTTSFLEVYLSATDSQGLSRTVRQDVHPRMVGVTFDTEPSGLKLTVNGETLTTPRTIASWVGYRLNVRADAQTTPDGRRATFAAWSDGGAAAHTITTPSAGGRYTARFDVAASGSQAVSSFTLINADTNRPIAGYDPIPDGATLDLAALPTRRLNVRANTTPARVGSVRFFLNGSLYRTENGAPYALASDTRGDYHPWTPARGTYTLRAVPYSGSSGGGAAGTAGTVRFTVR
ncbi:PQQ-dependent sugar dehydrogenase [Truepera radiovictrix]|uniref:PKD domain containing protein n=1 Tax=Truepera radiovictrix (strain DSM 17093 / CIP 108686 / LMG 22925 / RQ-24) TaxID=649638 RepID=D7CVY8_TRURR|nr:PQQ-dependent sugar dehydrogenase [Truepera radiovictrix]ADI14251.1 PKD domain containing protein [Truepera radiovictrix DSM 17093]WMT57192.1 PQQ-dependent sugar dehydrogenase [Truepera radiovictrix]